METVKGTEGDVPLSLALFAAFIFCGGYFYLTYFRFHADVLPHITAVANREQSFCISALTALIFNFVVLSVFLKRSFGFEKQGSKLAVLAGRSERRFKFGLTDLLGILFGVASFFAVRSLTSEVATAFVGRLLTPKLVLLLGRGLAINFAISIGLFMKMVLVTLGSLKLNLSESHKLDEPDTRAGELVLGTSPGEIGATNNAAGDEKETWVSLPPRGINAGVLITGSVGSGKTQGTLLRYLPQLVGNPAQAPAMLLIDPKGMYLKEAEAIIKRAGLGSKLVRISLRGRESFNPVYCEDALKDSRYTALAEMVRAAAVNFMGKASDSPFWEISSTNLFRNTIIYCAAMHGYFTLLDVYKTIVEASEGNLGRDLKLKLIEEHFSEEERFNIESAVKYFDLEYSKLEDRVRTGIMATSTAFINQFQEFAASRVLCPKKSDLTIPSMEDAIRQGKIILFDIQQPGLARSMGTFVKLHFQQAVLNLLGELKDRNQPCTSAIIIDEYQDVVTCGGGGTLGDDTFMAKARESRPAVIVATQSMSSLMDAIGSERPAEVLAQNFRTRIACHSSDMKTVNWFKDLAGKVDVENQTHSYSETSQSARPNLIAGGFDSPNSSLNESVSRGLRQEDLVGGREFSRLRTFEAFAQVFDGVETKFMRLYLKPSFLKVINVKHKAVLAMLTESEVSGKANWFKKAFASVRTIIMSLFLAGQVQAATIPNVCSVASSPAFRECLDLEVGACACGFPPHPCALISYYVPQTFIEVWPEQRQTYFKAVPGVAAQLAHVLPAPFGAEADDDTYSAQAHLLSVPLASLVFKSMPSGGTRTEKMCFDGMSEDFGDQWKTGKGDLLQPSFLAWGVSPKACLVSGALTSATGSVVSAPQPDSSLCSFPLPKLSTLPPSSHLVCNGWGIFYPRYGTYNGPASLTGALMIASRARSLTTEVLHSSPQGTDEKWQMVYPQSSSCFREGQNVGLLETIKNAREIERLVNGKVKGYLFVVWSKTMACKEMPTVAQAQAAALAIPAACGGMK